jgi:hypothetical protein
MCSGVTGGNQDRIISGLEKIEKRPAIVEELPPSCMQSKEPSCLFQPRRSEEPMATRLTLEGADG